MNTKKKLDNQLQLFSIKMYLKLNLKYIGIPVRKIQQRDDNCVIWTAA